MFPLIFAATPTPSPTYVGDDAVTPGWIGFIAIFAIALITVFLVLDMTRRIRRVRYREEVRAQLDAEQAASDDN
jgi:TRAP-type C4-dicarboxylate transport system permease small subunit